MPVAVRLAGTRVLDRESAEQDARADGRDTWNRRE
jgi:hypothetical protein